MNSKALAKAIPGKTLTTIQSAVLAVILLIAFIASFGSMFTMDVDLDAEARADVMKTINDMTDGAMKDVEIPEEIEVSLPFMVKSFGSLGGIIKSAFSMMKAEDEADLQETMEDAGKTIKEDIMSQDFVNLIVFFVALVASFTSSVPLGLCHLFLLALVIVVPLVALINMLIGVIGQLKNLKDPDAAIRKTSKGFSGVLALFPLLLLVKVVVPELQLGGGIMTILVMCCIGLVVNFACSRLKYYEKPDFKYLNVLQILSACSLGAFLIFFFNMANSGIMATIFKRLGTFALKEGTDAIVSAAAKQKASVDFVPILLVLALVVILFMVINYVVQIFTRLACMSSSKSDTHIVTTVFGLAIIAIPMILMNHEKFALEFNEADSSAFTMVCVGLVLMLVLEIVLKVLSKSLCADVPAERRKEIVTGAYFYVEADEAPAEAPAEEAPVEEAPVEEAPAEEAPAEEEAK